MSTLLEVKDVCKRYGKKTALDHLNLTLESGHIVGLLGPNGSGKTTLIKLINGILTPDEGEILVEGMKIGVETKKVVSYLPDHTYLNMGMRVRDILDYFEDFYQDFDVVRAYDMLAKLSINPNDKLKSMSKGTKEKVQLIKWFAAKTKFSAEKKIKQFLERLGIEHYIPFRTVIKEKGGKKVKVEKPVIPNLIFIHSDYNTCLSLVNEYKLSMNYLLNLETRQLLVVPDKQMQDFMFLLDFSEDAVQVLNENLRQGDRVRVIKGEFAGIEGELIRIKGHKRVVVRLEGAFSLATTYIPGSYLERI